MAFGKKKGEQFGPKKKYIYMAIKGSTKKPAFNGNGDVIFSNTTEEGTQVVWNIQLKDKVPKHVEEDLIDLPQYREEVVRKEDDDDKQLAKDRAKDALREKHKDLIEEARASMKGQKDKKNNKVEEKILSKEELKVEEFAEEPKKEKVENQDRDSKKPEEKKESDESQNVDESVAKEPEPKEEEEVEESKETEIPLETETVEDKQEKKQETKKDNAKKAEPKQGQSGISKKDLEQLAEVMSYGDDKLNKHLDTVERNTQATLASMQSMNGVYKEISGKLRQQAEGHSVLEKLEKTNGSKLKEIAEQTEMFQGQLKKLDQIDKIAEILEDKGLEIRKTADPSSRKEEDIVNMSRYAVAIIDQLTVASCELIKRQAAFDQKASALGNVEAEFKSQLEAEKKTGVKEGKLEMIQAILNKFTDGVDVLRTSENPAQKVVWTALCEQGLEVKYTKDDEVEFSAEDAEKYAAKFKGIDGAGKYTVTKSGLSFDGKEVFAAEFEKKTE